MEAYSLLFTVQKMSDDLLKLQRLISESKAEAAKHGVEGPLWQIIDQVVGYSDNEKSLSSDGLALVAQTKDADLLMGVMEVESSHRIRLATLHKLTEVRTKFEAETAGLEVAVQGQTISYGATAEEYAKIAATLIRLGTLSTALEDGLPEAVERARSVGERLGPHLKKHFKFEHFMQLSYEA